MMRNRVLTWAGVVDVVDMANTGSFKLGQLALDEGYSGVAKC